MSANDKAAATHGRQPMTIAETLDAHRWVGVNPDTMLAYCHCGWDVNAFCSRPAHRDHQAEMLEPLIVAREHGASRQAFAGAAAAIDSQLPNMRRSAYAVLMQKNAPAGGEDTLSMQAAIVAANHVREWLRAKADSA